MARILITVSAHLCTVPRPQKEAETLAQAGHSVTVHGCWFDENLAERDRALMRNRSWTFTPVLDFRPEKSRVKNVLVRVRTRFARECYLRFGRVALELFGYGAKEMLRSARRFRADLTIVHLEAGLWVGAQLLDDGFCVGVDFEDWFSEDLPPEARRYRPVERLRKLEARLARECSYCLTTSHAMAEALSRSYTCRKPAVVYNSFPELSASATGQGQDRRNPLLPSLHWFSQTLGPDRGLDLLMLALPLLKNRVEIHLRGTSSDSARKWLESLIPLSWQDMVFLHPTVPTNELPARIAEHDIGLALEIPYCGNKQYTVSNKLLQYLQAGLAVIATDTTGQREVLSQCMEAGALIPPNSPEALASAIDSLTGNQSKLQQAKRTALTASRSLFAWQKQGDVIRESAKLALNHAEVP